MLIKSKLLCLAVFLFAIAAVSACTPASNSTANPTVRGDSSTIAGDRDATTLRKSQ